MLLRVTAHHLQIVTTVDATWTITGPSTMEGMSNAPGNPRLKKQVHTSLPSEKQRHKKGRDSSKVT